MLANLNQQPGFGDIHIAFLAGRVAEYVSAGDLVTHIIALAETPTIVRDYESAVSSVPEWQTKAFPSLWAFRSFRILLHALIRDIKPKHVIETGVLHGMTSGFILEAIALNGAGALTSIDLPSLAETGPANRDGYNDSLPVGKQPGWIVPPRLHKHWDLKFGSSRTVLPEVCASVESIDVFIHDSEHSYSTMWFELITAWDAMHQGGILICDNIEANTSFFDFCRRVGRIPLVLPTPSEDRFHAPRFALIVR
jgi:hypothetical protein